jgi:hypothetical protein
MSKQNIPIDEILVIGAELISDSEPKTRAGKVLRWVKKLVKIKTSLGINIKK